MDVDAAPARSVLVVEDDFDIRDSLRDVLEGEGFGVVEAENGAEALDRLREARDLPCMLLLDLMMPVMDGWSLMALLRRDVRYASIPVVVVSAAGDRQAPPGAVRFIKKPYSIDCLLGAVRSLCSLQQRA